MASKVSVSTQKLVLAACETQQVPRHVCCRIDKLLAYLRLQNPRTHIILLALLPRGGNAPKHKFSWPSDYRPAIADINFRQQEPAAREPDYIHYLDCGGPLIASGQIEQSLQPDALHPNAEGMELVAQCLAPFVHQYAQE